MSYRLVGLVLLGILGFTPLVVSQEQEEDPILSVVKAKVRKPEKPFTMIVSLKIKKGTNKEFEKAFAKAITATRKEKGNIAYDLNRQKRTQYLVYERWKSVPALEEHLKSKHITTLLGELKEILAGPPKVRILFPAGE